MSAPDIALTVDIAMFKRLLAIEPTGKVVSADNWRTEFNLAQVSSAHIAALFTTAVRRGWLTKHGYGPSTIGSRKGGMRWTYRVTGAASS